MSENIKYRLRMREGSAHRAEAIALTAGGGCNYTAHTGEADVAIISIPSENRRALEEILESDDDVLEYAEHVDCINPHDYIVVRDSQFCFPVRRLDVKRAGKTEDDLRRMSGEEYGAWCQDVPMDASRGTVGSQGCIDFCEELIEAGAEVWDIA